MAQVRVTYWKEIPVSVQADGDGGRVTRPLDARFQEGVDQIAMFDGSVGTDDYLTAWDARDWGTVDGTAEEAAAAVADRINSGFPRDFVERVRALEKSGERNPAPGGADHWIDS